MLPGQETGDAAFHSEANILNDIHELACTRKVVVLKMEAVLLGMEEEDIWKEDEDWPYTINELRDLAGYVEDDPSELGEEEASE